MAKVLHPPLAHRSQMHNFQNPVAQAHRLRLGEMKLPVFRTAVSVKHTRLSAHGAAHQYAVSRLSYSGGSGCGSSPSLRSK